MLETSDKIGVLNKLLSNNIFSKSEQYSELLKFLVQSEINKTPIKEYTIGIEILKKGKKFDPALDPSVRTYMYRLRNKLKSYYEDEGSRDKIKITIPKGHYDIKFVNRSFVKRNLHRKSLSIYIIFISIILLLVLINILTINYYNSTEDSSQNLDYPICKNDPIWNDFFSNSLPTTIVVGDHFLFLEINDDSNNFKQIMDFSITTLDKFENFVKNNSEKKFIKGLHGGLPTNALWNIYDLSHVFSSFGHNPNIEFSSLFIASQFDLTNIENRNIVYIGGFRNLRELSSIIKTLPIEYEYTDIFKGEVRVHDNKVDSILTFVGKQLDKHYHQDIGLVIKLSGQNNENYIFFIGFAFPAQIETVRLLSRNDKLANLYSQLKYDDTKFPKHFFLVMEILCTEFSAIETEVKHFQVLP